MAILRWRPLSQGVERWDPFRDLSEIQSEMNRLFDSFFGRPGQGGGPERVWAPAIDMYETRDELVVQVELPGVNEKNVNVSITGDLLTIRGERHAADTANEGAYYRAERWYGKFERTIPLPFRVQVDKVKATFRDGVLSVKVPKAEEIKPREVKIDVM